jgi:hypothetical protein
MAVIIRRVSRDSYVWSCTKDGVSGSGKTEAEARAKYAAHVKSSH